MRASAFRWGACVVLACAIGACGGKKNGPAEGVSAGGMKDGGPKTMKKPDAGAADASVKHDASAQKDSGPSDAGSDGSSSNPFDYDASGDYTMYMDPNADAGPPPDAWSCPAAMWADGTCDCGCSVADFDCKNRPTGCIDPGCVPQNANNCDACFTLSGSWKPCTADPDPQDWSCDPLQMADGLCDCGCGIADPDCFGQGCSEPGCRTPKCDVRHGCSAAQMTAGDDCSTVNPTLLTGGAWKCPWDRYASGDGCDCGCGVPDPDCANGGGCTAGRCYEASCDRCSDAQGRPYSCDAAQAGWDDDIVGDSSSQEPSQCNGTHFGTGDGCDCGCGGHDPDCGSAGCDLPGCMPNDGCDRCTDAVSLRPSGCNVPSGWTCDAKHFGTGDGCDCGCGAHDPDCGSGNDCTGAGCTADGCDVCNDGAGGYVQCPGWTCTTNASVGAFGDAVCDCGCGVIDPFCRDTGRVSCTGAGCETAACQNCNDSDGNRTACGGEWTSNQGGASSACNLQSYGLDGLCDCGCGAHDPDCGSGNDCTGKGCVAEDCDVCHDGSLLKVCTQWTCDASAYGTGDGCDCGCGAPDPDCAGGGCTQPGCKDKAGKCDTCHDPFGRPVACP